MKPRPQAVPASSRRLALGAAFLVPLAGSAASYAAVSQVTNTATVTSSNNDPDPTSNSSTAATAVQPSIVTVPTVSGLGLVALAVLLVAGGWLISRRRAARA